MAATLRMIAIEREAILATTDKAVLVSLPKGWRFWHARKMAYQHPDDPSLFLVLFYGADTRCFREENRKVVAEQNVPWHAIARVTRGFYTAEVGYLTPLALNVGMAVFNGRRRLGRHVPSPLEPLTHVQPHASLIR